MISPLLRHPLLTCLALGLTGACASLRTSAPAHSVATMNRADALASIAKLEDARSEGHGQLIDTAKHSDPQVRARALTALGRLPLLTHGPRVTEALGEGLTDANASVRASAAFALGMRADPESASALLAAVTDLDDATRAAIIEASSKVGTPELRHAVIAAIHDPSRLVRIEAAVGPHRWNEDLAPDETAAIDGALVELASKQVCPDRVAITDASLESPDVLWRALFSLHRRGSSAARDVFIEKARCDADVLIRLFAVKGLAGLDTDDDVREELEHALRDPDWRVVIEALKGLSKVTAKRSIDAIERTLAHPAAQVRAAAFEALGHQQVSDRITRLLEGARVDRSSTVRASAFEAEVRLRGAVLAPDIELKMTSKDPLMRAACARAATRLPSELAVPYLIEISKDGNLRVAGLAIEGLGSHPTPASRDRLRALLQGRDNGRRLAAVLALRASPNPEDLSILRRAFARSEGDIGAEVKFNCLHYAAELGGDEAMAFARAALTDEQPYVRKVAYQVLVDADRAPGQAPSITFPQEIVPSVGKELPTTNPIVEISTGRGRMTFELFADEAPVHVFNFLQLALADHYDGLTFHRVVPDFVVQGGCYRGDGNGANPWRGDALRHEITPRKYVRGSLGMPRNEDIESGGSQFFVTHCPTPHLDGRYTIFGELRSGGQVLDAIEVGEVIVDVRVLGE